MLSLEKNPLPGPSIEFINDTLATLGLERETLEDHDIFSQYTSNSLNLFNFQLDVLFSVPPVDV